MLDVLAWLLVIEVLGILAFPFAFLLFRRLPDRGYTLTKPLGLAFFSYVYWLLGLTGHIPNSPFTIAVILLAGLVGASWLARNRFQQVRCFLKREWPTLLVAEGIFLVFFLVWLGLVSQFPAINHTEKPMDFAFFNAALVGESFPPEDPWLSGHPISYYYFGHLMMAFLNKITAVPSSVGYNIAISLAPALVAIGCFGLLHNLVRLSGGQPRTAFGFGLLAVVLVTLMGNLEGVLEFVHARGWGDGGFWQWAAVKGLAGETASGSGIFPGDSWWWWRATRVIDTLDGGQSLDYTITEFPFFSFILGDLHPHVVGLPFLLLFLSLSLAQLLPGNALGPKWLRTVPQEALATSLLLGVVAFTNFWDFPVCLAVWTLIVYLKNYARETANSPLEHTRVLVRTTFSSALVVAPVAFLAVFLFLPFYLELSSQASGILPVGEVGTRPFLFFLVMGVLSLLGVSFLLRQLPGLCRPGPQDVPVIGLIIAATLLPVLLWVLMYVALTLITEGAPPGFPNLFWRILWVLPGMLVFGLATFSASQRTRLGREGVLAFPLLLLAVGSLLLIGAELFYLVDLFGNRMNTVFKTYYQAWLLLGLAGAYGIYYWHSRRPWRPVAFRIGHYAWTGVVGVLVALSLYYPVGATLERTGFLDPQQSGQDSTLDGLAFLQRVDPAEYAAIVWLRDEATPGRIVEAVGGDYSAYGRVSSSTGLPTVLGWAGHEHQWRGDTSLFDGRSGDVAQIYRCNDAAAVGELLEHYGIRYVYWGSRERDSYGNGHLEEFEGLLKTVFQRGSVIVYERVGLVEGSDGR